MVDPRRSFVLFKEKKMNTYVLPLLYLISLVLVYAIASSRTRRIWENQVRQIMVSLDPNSGTKAERVFIKHRSGVEIPARMKTVNVDVKCSNLLPPAYRRLTLLVLGYEQADYHPPAPGLYDAVVDGVKVGEVTHPH